jgi:hypothetical protein
MSLSPEQVCQAIPDVREATVPLMESGHPFQPNLDVESVLFGWKAAEVRIDMYGSTNTVEDIKVVDIARQLVKDEFPQLSQAVSNMYVQGCDLKIRRSSVYHITGGRLKADFHNVKDECGNDFVAHRADQDTTSRSFDLHACGYEYTGFIPIRAVSEMKNHSVLTIATSSLDHRRPLVSALFHLDYRVNSIFDQASIEYLRATHRHRALRSQPLTSNLNPPYSGI